MIPAILLSGIVVTLVRATTVVTEGALGNGAFRGQLEGCPELCSTSGPASSDWERYKGNEELLACDKPMLLDFSLNKPVDDADAALFACSGTLTTQSVHSDRVEHCADSKTAVPVSVRTIWSGTPVGNVTSLCTAVQNVMSHVALKSSGSDCSSREAMSSFGYANGSFVGIYVGGRVHHQAAADMVQTLVDNVQTKGVQGDRYVAQICGADRTGAHTVGIVAVSSSDPGDLGALGFVQNSVRLWQNAICVSDFKTSSVSTSIDTITINEKPVRGGVPAAPNTEDAAFDDSLNAEETDRDEDQGSHLCKTEKVVAGDGCHSLAKECGISGAQFEKYNSYKPNLCGTLVPGQHVCCTKGKLPDFTPKPYKNGTCFTYNLQPGDSCSGLAASHSLTVTKIDKYNQHTWGWMGCKDALAYMNICLSPGKPPMPAPVTGTRCGPQKPGTKVPEDGGLNYLAKLNPCPLNACCDIWGQCGVTPEFCHKTQSKTGAPGTAKKGTNGCISHCGLDVVKGDAPATVRSVAYFEEYNMGRPCLNMDVRTLRGYAAYTHVHWAFGGITHDFTIDVSGAKDSFARFVSMPAPFQKVVSLGGWAFSTHPSTYNIFREAVKPANRHKFASNVAKFLQKHGLHGVDFDWEYPGEPDIPGIPAGNKDDGANYLAFLRELRQQMPATRSISVAAPASYWYLKHFPIAEISHVVDYIVYMTYDLHGQWDYGNKWASPGCKHGNCLRSHVNMTETHWALAMITKAGVPSAKVVAGVAAYGRSFQMTDPSCHGPHCTFTGPKSGATPGNCTRTAGYISNAELNDIRRGLHDGPNIKLNAIRTQNDNQQPIFNSPNMDKQGENDSLTSTDLHLQGSNTPWTTKSNMTGSETGTDNSASGGKVTEYFDSASQSNILLYDHDNWAAYMTPENLAARQETYRSLNLGGTALWALDLASFVLPYNSFDPTSEGIDPAHVDCTIPAVAHLTNKLTPKQRWQDTGAPAEWANAMVHWKKYRKKHGPNKGYQFSEWMGKRLKAPPGMHCESMSNDQTCTDNLQCIDAADFGPAKWAITNSMIGLHKSFSVPYNALHQVWETMNSAAGVVVNDFATVSTDDSLNLMLDFALLGFLLVAAPLFNVGKYDDVYPEV